MVNYRSYVLYRVNGYATGYEVRKTHNRQRNFILFICIGSFFVFTLTRDIITAMEYNRTVEYNRKRALVIFYLTILNIIRIQAIFVFFFFFVNRHGCVENPFNRTFLNCHILPCVKEKKKNGQKFYGFFFRYLYPKILPKHGVFLRSSRVPTTIFPTTNVACTLKRDHFRTRRKNKKCTQNKTHNFVKIDYGVFISFVILKTENGNLMGLSSNVCAFKSVACSIDETDFSRKKKIFF